MDHYHPVASGGEDNDDNLVYACPRCNQYKSDTFLEISPAGVELRLLHPLLDSLEQHIRQNTATSRLEPLTERGRFHITVLRLNRRELILHRQEKRVIVLLTERIELYRQENLRLREEIAIRDEFIVRLETRLKQVSSDDP